MPTWRQSLAGHQLQAGGWAREVNPAFFESEFHHEWSGVLRSTRLAALAKEHGLDAVFVPHPNLKPYVPLMELPAHVAVKTYDRDDVQEILSRAAVVVTDYSSVAFDAAFIRRPIAYFQFDKAAVFGGGHITKPGYFSYERDGFGPVSARFDDLMDHVAASLDPAGTALEEYRERMDRTFTLPQHRGVRPGDGDGRTIHGSAERPESPRQSHDRPGRPAHHLRVARRALQVGSSRTGAPRGFLQLLPLRFLEFLRNYSGISWNSCLRSG